MSTRPFCKVCNKNHRAISYYRGDKCVYRSRCSQCIRKNKTLPLVKPRWSTNGYSKKKICDICGFKSTYSSQITVYHIDGNLNNSDLINLRSICLNCVEVVKRKLFTWRPGDLEVD